MRALESLAAALCFTGCGLVVGVDFDAVEPATTSTGATGHGGSGGAGTGGGGAGGAAGEGGAGGSTCDPVAAELDAEGCPCATEGAVRDCYLGDPGPASACSDGGTQQCSAGVWGACIGAVAPSPEQCLDGIDQNCDGVVDEGCPCSGTVDMCDGLPQGDTMILPAQIQMRTTFDLYVVSTQPLPEPKLLINGGYCAGGAGNGPCNPGAGCPGWSAVRQTVAVNDPPFQANTVATLTMLIGDAGAPCDGDQQRSVSAMVPVVP
jgi:hypothetical protein